MGCVCACLYPIPHKTTSKKTTSFSNGLSIKKCSTFIDASNVYIWFMNNICIIFSKIILIYEYYEYTVCILFRTHVHVEWQYTYRGTKVNTFGKVTLARVCCFFALISLLKVFQCVDCLFANSITYICVFYSLDSKFLYIDGTCLKPARIHSRIDFFQFVYVTVERIIENRGKHNFIAFASWEYQMYVYRQWFVMKPAEELRNSAATRTL